MNSFTLLSIVLCVAFVSAQTLPTLDAQLTPPASQYSSFVNLHATGFQNYTCVNTTWTLKAPDARLFDDSNRLQATHFAGPTWQCVDGSAIVGQAINSTVHGSTNVAWLLLRSISNTGTGAFSNVRYVVRYNTNGGVAPSSACTNGDQLGVAYTADYLFFSNSTITLPNNSGYKSGFPLLVFSIAAFLMLL
jgi:hypothetical protein